ncbi:hypothetical protein ABIE58_004115, partial [Roseovarius sp. MBR-78]
RNPSAPSLHPIPFYRSDHTETPVSAQFFEVPYSWLGPDNLANSKYPITYLR